IEYENPPPLIFGGSYFNIIRAIIFAIVLLTLTISGKFLVKLVLISLVVLGVHAGKRADTFKSFNIYFAF
ncbi:uncharacterized protein EV154DRAFT_514744, partial [Mucor mucedo]|uniref:uncharacterized protein n=1 Tax=Mucor mucedo TaxID=29922 RepID=UPI00221F82DA